MADRETLLADIARYVDSLDPMKASNLEKIFSRNTVMSPDGKTFRFKLPPVFKVSSNG